VIAAIGGIMAGSLNRELDELAGHEFPDRLRPLARHLGDARVTLDRVVQYVKEKKDTTFHDFHARRVVDIAVNTYMGYLVLAEALESEHKACVAEHFVHHIVPLVSANAAYILDDEEDIVQNHQQILAGT